MSVDLSSCERFTADISSPNKSIFDIRSSNVDNQLTEEVLKSLHSVSGSKSLPTMLLYNERGLQLFEEITHLEEYYLTKSEIDILMKSACEIASLITSGSMVVELGSGNLRKVIFLLKEFEKQKKKIDYYALDLCAKELKRTLDQTPPFQYVNCYGLHGTYEDGLLWIERAKNRKCPKVILSLGSSIGNFQYDEAQEHLRKISRVLMPGDILLIGMDHTNDASKVYHAYNDQKGITHQFILNGLESANEILGRRAFNITDWRVIGEYVYDSKGGRHQAFLTPIRDISYGNYFHIKAGERIQIERSFKFSIEQTAYLFKESELRKSWIWPHLTESYNLYLLTKSVTKFESNSALNDTLGLPTIQDWRNTWGIWDLITNDLTPENLIHSKSIELRNPFIFYFGHIPTFLDIQISKFKEEPVFQSSNFYEIFERGIDPDVDDPKKCHQHSIIPDSWPSVKDILQYQLKVRAKVHALYETDHIPRNLARVIWLGFEHELMHIETYLYMLLESGESLPPTKETPNFEVDAIKAKEARVPNEWFHIPKQQVKIGLDDPEDNLANKGPFGWDNEKPSRTIEVPSFQAQARPLTNEDYLLYLVKTHKIKIPASWTFNHKPTNQANSHFYDSLIENSSLKSHLNEIETPFLTKENSENIYVRTLYDLVPLNHALDWPVTASYDELAGCAKWMNARIPTFEEVRSIYSYVESQRSKEAPINTDHVRENNLTLPLNSTTAQSLFANLDRANVGLKNWHPVAVTNQGHRLAGQAEMGGVWEWTSSTLQKYEGFEPMSLYPGYTADFFDGKHNIILGGSWATHPRIAGRKSFINWYQRNYPYTWAGARLVRDL
ncbi:Ergothioneine biosynthesis protein 1 [Erysiphe neolycopersici]|uniref:Ergothioneine biosynthesis protein 1 n=1 Tax=Erysiphe neolycopersici TaxID=212602 RepID=A0A420HN99_9PEZI|nr:Ergothioneine biosynthesis protein 1 [Erysiphe neolycopersici]